ncbi:hypothetical protein Tco_1481032 [Tanacetum coccineum]
MTLTALKTMAKLAGRKDFAISRLSAQEKESSKTSSRQPEFSRKARAIERQSENKAGYRVLTRLDYRRYSRLVVMGLKLLSPSYPLYFWLGKGRPLSPEAHVRLVRLLRAKLKPRELVLPPDELFETEESRDFLEYSLLYGWMDAPVFKLTLTAWSVF